MKRVACLLLLSATLARADGLLDEGPPVASDRGYGALGVSLLWSAPDAVISTWTAEGAIRVPKTPLLARAVLGYGGGSDGGEDTSTRVRDLRLGLEADTCTSRRGGCAFIGADFGWRFSETTFHAEEMTRDTSDWIRVYRFGGDAGGDFIRVRAEFEIAPGAAGLQLALVHRFY